LLLGELQTYGQLGVLVQQKRLSFVRREHPQIVPRRTKNSIQHTQLTCVNLIIRCGDDHTS
jgi:hypothetical protein